MHSRRFTLWLTLLTVVVTVLAGCAPRAFSGANASQPGTDNLVIDLPALVVDFDAQGNPSVGNVPLSQLGALLPPGTLDSLVFPAEIVTLFTESNIQHIQIDNTPNGLLVLVNGQAMPSLKWDGKILADTGSLVSQLGAGTPVLEKFLPVLTNLGIGVIMRFPVQAGAAAIPTYIPTSEAAIAAKQAQAEFLASVANNPPTIRLPVFYNAQGGWRVGDLSDVEWTNLTGLPFQAAVLDPGMMQSIMAAGITEISIYTDPAGLHMSINGRALPYIGWADGEINHLLALSEQLGLWDTLADSGMNMGQIIGLVETLLPIVQSTEMSINVFFPGSMAMAN